MSNKVSITDLLTAVGSDNIRFQDVMSSMENIKSSKGATIISFATDAMSPGDVVTGSGPKGLVLWIDQSLMKQRINELKEGKGLTYGRLLEQRDELLACRDRLVEFIEAIADTCEELSNDHLANVRGGALGIASGIRNNLQKVKGGAA